MSKNPMLIDTAGARVAAAVSSKDDGRPRWTELNVFYLDTIPLGGRRWLAEAVGMSTVDGERTKRRRIASASLDRALELFDDSDLGVIAKAEAREFAEAEGLPDMHQLGVRVPAGERDALAWLYGVDEADLSINAAAEDLDTGESSLRMALKQGRAVKVPLRAILPFVDRVAFQAAMRKRGNRG